MTGPGLPRRLFVLATLAATPLASAQAQMQAASPQEAAVFIQNAGSELARVVSGAESVAAKRQRLLPFLDQTVDVDGIARFCLDRYWQAATPAQRAEYMRLFRIVLANGVAGRLGDYQEGTTSVTTGRPDVREDGIYVPTTVRRGSNPPNKVTWLVIRGSDGSFRIADVVAEGVSLRLTQRNDYGSFLSRHGGDVGALIQAMATQVAQG